MPQLPIPSFVETGSTRTAARSLGIEKPTLAVDSIARASQSVTNAYNQEQARRQAEQDQLQQNEDRIYVINTANRIEADARAQLSSDIEAGNYAGATERVLQSFDEQANKATETARSPRAQQSLRLHMAQMRGQLNNLAYGAEMQARKEGLASDYMDGVAEDRKLAYTDERVAVQKILDRQALADSLQLDPKTKARLAQQARQGIARDAVSGMIDRDVDGFLARAGGNSREAAAMAAESDPLLAALSGDDYRNLMEHARAKKAALEAKQQTQADWMLKDAEQATNQLQSFVNTGAVPDVNYIEQAKVRTAGTPFAAQVDALVDVARKGAGFGAQSIPRQRQILAAADAAAAQGTTPEAQKEMEHLRNIHQEQVKAYADDPWTAANRFQHMTPVPEVVISAPEGGVAVIRDRSRVISSVETAAGGPVSPLRPNEAASWAATLKTLDVSQRAEVLAEAGKTLSGGQLKALADQIDKNDRPTALALKLADRTGAGRTVAAAVLRGAQGLADKTVKRDDAVLTGWKAEIAGMVRGTLGNSAAEQDIIDAAYYVRADGELTAPAGYDKPVGTSARDALATVVGLPLERAGVKTLLPRGMSESDFDARLRAVAKPEALIPLTAPPPKGETKEHVVYANGVPIPVSAFGSRIAERGLRMYSPGVYVPVVGTSIVTVDPKGTKPLTLKVQ